MASRTPLPLPPLRPVMVLIVEGNAASRVQLATLMEQDRGLLVVGSVASPQTALEFMRRRLPDVVLLDESASGMGGVEGTRRILQAHAVPIVLSANAPSGGPSVVRAMELGAVAWVYKPHHANAAEVPVLVQRMCQTLRLMAEVTVVRQWGRQAGAACAPPGLATPMDAAAALSAAPPAPTSATTPVATGMPRAAAVSRPQPVPAPRGIGAEPRGDEPRADARGDARPASRVVGIGSSTGGPPVLQTILSGLPKPFDAPLLVVQHMAPGFLQGLADWLAQSTGVPVRVAEHGMVPQKGQAYLAPDGCQMVLSAQGSLSVRPDAAPALHQPSVAALFRSMAEVCGPRGVGVLLTGMGRDGADELKLMRDRGAVTIAQDRESSVVHGMPGEAIAMGAATYVLPPVRIAITLASLMQTPARAAPRPDMEP